MTKQNYISSVSIEEKSLMRGDANKSERERAITDIIKENNFDVIGHAGPYDINIEVINNKILLNVKSDEQVESVLALPILPLRRLMKDYHIICESYFEAVNNADPRRIEAIDMGRRGVHNEGAEIIEELLDGYAKMCFETARKLFSLVYILQIK